jgi:hypothetical protein
LPDLSDRECLKVAVETVREYFRRFEPLDHQVRVRRADARRSTFGVDSMLDETLAVLQ